MFIFTPSAGETTPRRVLSYAELSETASVRFTQKIGDLVAVGFAGRYIGPAKSGS